jgi:hypothetical protein
MEEDIKIINTVAVQTGPGESLYLPFIIIGTSIKEDQHVINLINELLYPAIKKLSFDCNYTYIHRLYGHYLIIINEIINRDLLVSSCVDLVFDDETSYYNNIWEVTFKRFNTIKRILSKDATNFYYYFARKNDHIVKDSYSYVEIMEQKTHPYMIFVYTWALMLRQEKLTLDAFLHGVPRFTVNEISKLALRPSCIRKEGTKVVLINAHLKNKLKQCPLWMASNYSLKRH